MVDAAAPPVVAILTRAPSSPGKTRLFRSLGIEQDPALVTALLLDTLDGAAAAGVQRVVAVTPALACEEVRGMAGEIEVMPQPDGELGERMRGVMTTLLARGAAAVALIGSDLPELTPAIISEALAYASRDPDTLVLGPAIDGGYYLIAASRLPNVFSGIMWSQPDVLARTEAAAVADKFAVRRLSPLSDVDTADDLRRACAGGSSRRVCAWLRRFDQPK